MPMGVPASPTDPDGWSVGSVLRAQSTRGRMGTQRDPPKATGRKLVHITHTSRGGEMYAARRSTVLGNRWELEAGTRRQARDVGAPQTAHNSSEIPEGQFFARDTGVACV